MRKTARMLLALGMSVAMVASLAGCNSKTTTETTAATQATEEGTTVSSETEEATEEAGGYANTGVTVEEGKGIDFEDGNSGFITFDTVVAGANDGEVSIVDFNGSKAAKLDTADRSIGVDATGATTETPVTTPYIAIDVSTLLGDKVVDCKGIQFDLAAEYSDGEFHAISGSVYAGNSTGAKNDTYSVYIEKSNPKTITFTDDSIAFTTEEPNIFMFSVSTVGAPATEIPTLYIDNIIFLDADGNAIEIADDASEFNEAGMGVIDWSNGVKEPVGEVTLTGVGGDQNNNWWPVDTNMMTTDQDVADAMGYNYVDPSLLTPDSVITIYFTCDTQAVNDGGAWQAPYLRLGQWDELSVDGEVVKTLSYDTKFTGTDISPIIDKDETITGDGITSFDQIQEDTMINKSWSIVQYTYAQIAEVTGDENWPNDLTFMGIADMGMDFVIDKVTIGTVSSGDAVSIANATGSSSNWGQAVTLTTIKNDNGTFDPAVITPGTKFIVDFTAENVDDSQAAPLELIFQSWSGGEGWAKVAPATCTDSQAIFEYDDIVAAYGGLDNFEETLDAINVGDCNCNLTVIGVSYVPGE